MNAWGCSSWTHHTCKQSLLAVYRSISEIAYESMSLGQNPLTVWSTSPVSVWVCPLVRHSWICSGLSVNQCTAHRLVFEIIDEPGWNLQWVQRVNLVHLYQVSTNDQSTLRCQSLRKPCLKKRETVINNDMTISSILVH